MAHTVRGTMATCSRRKVHARFYQRLGWKSSGQLFPRGTALTFHMLVYGPRDDGSEALRPWLTAWRDGQSARRKASYLVSQNRRGSRTLSSDTRNVRRNWARTHQACREWVLKRNIWSVQSAHLRGDAHHRLRSGQ